MAQRIVEQLDAWIDSEAARKLSFGIITFYHTNAHPLDMVAPLQVEFFLLFQFSKFLWQKITKRSTFAAQKEELYDEVSEGRNRDN